MKHSAWLKGIVLVGVLVVATSAWAQPIYKVVDEHGNVTYTDQKPTADAEPMNLPELTPLGGETVPPVVQEEPEAARPEGMGFRIRSPSPNADVLSEDGSLTVVLDSSVPIPSSARVVLYIDGIAQEPTMGSRIVVEGIDAGEHSLRAELQTESGRMLAISDEIYVRVHHMQGSD
jgi:hypothetical protein